MTEVLRHSTDWPARICTVSGWKLAKPISTTADAFGEGGPCARPPRPQPAKLARASNPGMSQRAFDILLPAPPGASGRHHSEPPGADRLGTDDHQALIAQ